jgi:hypothetical protein
MRSLGYETEGQQVRGYNVKQGVLNIGRVEKNGLRTIREGAFFKDAVVFGAAAFQRWQGRGFRESECYWCSQVSSEHMTTGKRESL